MCVCPGFSNDMFQQIHSNVTKQTLRRQTEFSMYFSDEHQHLFFLIKSALRANILY